MTTAKTRGDIRKEYPTLDRGDGRIEIICPHGVGHTSKKLSIKHYGKWEDWMGVHGCDRCCDLAVFAIAEMVHMGEIDA